METQGQNNFGNSHKILNFVKMHFKIYSLIKYKMPFSANATHILVQLYKVVIFYAKYCNN